MFIQEKIYEKFIYIINKDNQKIGKISLSKDLSTPKIKQLFAQIILNIREIRNEHEYDISIVELGKNGN